MKRSAVIDRRYRMTAKQESIEERIDRLQAGGIIDLHFDLPMDFYEKRERKKCSRNGIFARS
jgi:hypothetical protein